MATLALVLTLVASGLQGRAERQRLSLPPPCAVGAACCVWNLSGFCRVGCPPPHPVPIVRPAPDVTKISRPLPTGIAILELGINAEGRVVSACVLRGLRSDFDAAAQQAALRSQWKPQLLNGRPVGAVMTVTFVSPVPGHWSRPAVTLASALPITRGRTAYVAPSAACPPSKGEAVRVGSGLINPPLVKYAEPRAPSVLDVSGTVVLEAEIAGDGTVTRLRPLREVEGLTEAAAEAVRKWRFARTCVEGRPVALIKTIAVAYRIDPHEAGR